MTSECEETFKTFLQEYCESHVEAVNSDEPLPFRLLFRTFTQSDLEGECLDLCLQYLKTLSCPDLMNLAIAQATTSRVLASDLASCIKEQPNNDTEENHYDGTGVAYQVLTNLHNLCHEWNSNLPETLRGVKKPPQFTDCGIRNTRRKMEDRHNVFNNLNLLTGLSNLPTIQYYAVFDGHGGLDASCYAAKQLHLNLIQLENFQENLTESIKLSIKITDDNFCSKAKNERLRSGTTAVVAVIYEQVLHLAWIGDSQAVLVRKGAPMDQVMDPHKPEREDEKLRIEEMGGCVVWFGAWRVNGSLAVSRAIGDADHKPYVSGDADTVTIPLDGSEDFLCLACDGFWDVFTGVDLVNLVREYFKDPANERKNLAQTLCAKAKSEGSTDNISVVVVYLKDEINLPDPETNEVVTNSLAAGEGENGSDGNHKANNETIENTKEDTPSGTNNDNSNSNNNVQGGDLSKGIALVKGNRVEPTQKAKIPHKLLVNFVKKLHQKEVKKDLAIVTESSPHSKLPHSLTKPRWASPNISPNMQRRDTLDSVLSLSAVQTITEIPQAKTKTKRSTSELPKIEDLGTYKTKPQRNSIATNNYATAGKGLGHRAVRRPGLPRVPYAPSLVSCQTANEPVVSPRPLRRSVGYSQSIPGDLHHYHRQWAPNHTDMAITNSLAITLKPLKAQGSKNGGKATRQRSIVRLVHRGRQRSRSAF